MFDPGVAEIGGGGVLASVGIPEFNLSVLSAGGEEGRGAGGVGGGVGFVWLSAKSLGPPCYGIGAVVVAGQEVELVAVGALEKGDRAGGRGGGELSAVGRPREVDHVIVEDSGPVLGEVHVLEKCQVSGAKYQEIRSGEAVSDILDNGPWHLVLPAASAAGEAGFEGGVEGGAVEVFADENQGVGSGRIGPFAVKLRVEEHVHALEDEAFVGAFYAEHAFHAVDVGAFGLEELADPFVEAFAVEVAGFADADGGDGVFVRMGVREIFLPDGFHGVASDVNVEWVFATTFKYQVMAVVGNREWVVAVAVFE